MIHRQYPTTPGKPIADRRRANLILCYAAVLILLISACGAGGSAAGSRTDGLTVAWVADPSSLDPIKGSSGQDHAILWTIYDTLVDFSPDDLTPEPGLATSWEQPDPQSLTLHLRTGVKFHDGTPFDAKAVKFNIERARAKGSTIASDLSSVKAVDVVNAHTVTLRLSYPDTSLPLTLSDRAGMMVSPAAAEKADGDVSKAPVGAGPWKFVEWVSGSRVVVDRSPNYWNDDVSRVPRITFNIVTDPKTRLSAVRSGQADMTTQVPGADVKSLRADQRLKIVAEPSQWSTSIEFNLAKSPFDDIRVRTAINLALDRKVFVDKVEFGFGEPAWSPLPSVHWAYAQSMARAYPRNLDRARRLLAEAGHAKGLRFTMLSPSDPLSMRRSEIAQAQLAEAGITVDIVSTTIAQASEDFHVGGKAPALMGGLTGRADPAQVFTTLFGKDSYYNAGHVETPGLTKALQRANSVTDLSKRKAHLLEAARAVETYASYAPIAFQDAITLLRDGVEGFRPSLIGKPKFVGITVQR